MVVTSSGRSGANRIGSASLGIAFSAASFTLYTGMDTAAKLLSGGYPLGQIVFFNALFSLFPFACALPWLGGFAALAPKHLSILLLRGMLVLISLAAAFYAYSVMALADAYAVMFSAPLFITALSVPLLGEAVGWRRWAAVAVGFAGVLVMLRPGTGVLSLGAAACLVSALTYALGALILRRIATRETVAAKMLWPMLVMVAGSAPFAVPGFVAPGLADLAVLALCGMLGGVAQLCLIAAYRHAPAAIAAPFQYTQLLWGVAIGYAMWGDVPDSWMLLGSVFVIGSGLYIVSRELRAGRREARTGARVHV